MKSANPMWPSTAARLACATVLTAAALLAAVPVGAQPSCDAQCLNQLADRYVAATLARDAASLPWADRVRFTENDVGLMIGDGVWGSSTKFLDAPFRVADPTTGNVLWLGIVEEHGQAAYFAARLAVTDRKIADIETVVGREGTPAHFTRPAGYAVDPLFTQAVPSADRTARRRMVALVEGWYTTLEQNDGELATEISGDCRYVSNGVALSHREGTPAGCKAQLEAGLYRPVDDVRHVRIPLIDEERGIAVAIALLDHAARFVDYATLDGAARTIPVEYPNTHGVLELFKIVDGAIVRVEGIAVFQPYLMPTIWR